MIVVDTNILAYFYLPTECSEKAEALLAKDPFWCAPVLWRSEFRNVLALYLRKQVISFEQAIGIQSEAESLMRGNEFDLSSIDILALVNKSRCSAYDCEFVALAMSLKIRLVTADKKIMSEFPDIAVSLDHMLV